MLKTASVWVSSIQIMQVRVQNKGKRVWKSTYDGDVSAYEKQHMKICSKNNSPEGFIPFGLRLIFLLCKTLK